MAIAAIAFLGAFIVPFFTSVVQSSQAARSTPSPTAGAGSPANDLEAQARGYELVLQREPENQTALRGLVDIRIQQGDLAGTLEPLEKLAELNPDQPDYTVLLAQVKQRLGDREGAAQDYRGILASRPGDRNALQGLVNLLLDQGRPEAAISLLQDTLKTADEANQVQPGSVDVPSVQLLLGQVYAEEERYPESIEIYDRIIGGDANDFRPVLGKAIVLQAQGKDTEAQPLFASAAALAPAQYKDQINQIASGAAPNPLVAPAPSSATNGATSPPAPPATIDGSAAPPPSPAVSPNSTEAAPSPVPAP